jgi:hypothetical protein
MNDSTRVTLSSFCNQNSRVRESQAVEYQAHIVDAYEYKSESPLLVQSPKSYHHAPLFSLES